MVPTLVVGASLLAACEDGPNQTFSPATGILFNNGNVDGSAGANEAGYDANYVAKSVLQVCSAELKRTRWAQMLTAPMAPPALFAGLDLRGCGAIADPDPAKTAAIYQKPCEWPGLSIEQAETAPTLQPDGTYQGGNCQGNALGFGGCGENQSDICGNVTWGDNNEVNFSYDQGTHLIDQLDITLGYTGSMNMVSPPLTDPATKKPYTNCDKHPDYASDGTVACKSQKDTNCQHHYSLQMGFPLLKDGTALEVDWGTNSLVVSEVYDAFAYTFDAGAGIIWPGCSSAVTTTSGGCESDSTCLYINNDGSGTGYLGVRPIATYIQFHSTVPQPGASEPFNMYIDYAKFVPNSTLHPTLMANNSGPFTDDVPPAVTSGTKCHQFIGQSYAQYLTDCIEPYDPPGNPSNQANATNLGKLIGGHTHNLEELTFNVVGVNEDFTLTPNNPTNKALSGGTDLGTYGVVTDTQVPQPGDLSSEFYFDVRALGRPYNEYCGIVTNGSKCGGPGDRLTGSALIIKEYQRLLLADLARLNGSKATLPGDCQFIPGGSDSPGCVAAKNCHCVNPLTGAGEACPSVPKSHNGGVCTGMEGMMIPGLCASQDAKGNCIGYATDNKYTIGGYTDQFQYEGSLGAVLRPTQHYTVFLPFPGPASFAYADFGYLWDEPLHWIARVMGNGDLNSVPTEARDRRYFYKWFGVAYIKYMLAYGTLYAANPADVEDITKLNPDAVAQAPINLETLFFDNLEGGFFDTFEYIDLASIAGFGGNPTKPDPAKPYLSVPFDLEYGTDVKAANQRYINWFRRLDREEFALYQALSDDKAAPPASRANFGVNLTNMAGSSILNNSGVPWACASWPMIKGKFVPTINGKAVPTECVTNPATGAPKIMPPSWALDSNQTSLLDLNGQQRAQDTKTSAGALTTYGAFGDHSGMPYKAGVPDPTGTPTGVHTLLWAYPAAFGGSTVFTLGHSPIQVCPPGATDCADPSQRMSVTSDSLNAAQTMIPNFKNPWASCATKQIDQVKGTTTCDPADPAFASPLYALVPWLPNQPGVGFSIATNGQSSVEVQTAQLDFTGNLETYLVDYVPFQDPLQAQCSYPATGSTNGGCNPGFSCVQGTCVASDHSIEIRAIEAQDFLGELFVCKDPYTGDVLNVRMYSSTATILEWIAAHPGDPSNPTAGISSAQVNCGLIVRYSAFDNYPDFITSLSPSGSGSSDGMTLNTNQGQGFGRIVDATIFNSLYETITQ